MLIPSKSYLDIAQQKSLDLQREATHSHLINSLRPSFRFQIANQLHQLSHKLEPRLNHTKTLSVQEC